MSGRASCKCTKPFLLVVFKTMMLSLLLVHKHRHKFEVDVGLYTGGGRVDGWSGNKATLFWGNVKCREVDWVASRCSNTVLVFGHQEDAADTSRVVVLDSSVPGRGKFGEAKWYGGEICESSLITDSSIKTQEISQVPNMDSGREFVVWAEDFIVGW